MYFIGLTPFSFYDYDGIGNRLDASAGGDAAGANLDATAYTPNDRNQYAALTMPTKQWITGEAVANANVFVNGAWTWRNGTFFGGKVALGNGSGPVAKAITVKSKLPPSGGSMVDMRLG